MAVMASRAPVIATVRPASAAAAARSAGLKKITKTTT